jgi:hypothetical protein
VGGGEGVLLVLGGGEVGWGKPGSIGLSRGVETEVSSTIEDTKSPATVFAFAEEHLLHMTRHQNHEVGF